MSSNSRGFRAQGVLTEEVATITDQAKYEEIVAPMLVISRKINGEIDPNEVLNQNAMYVTSAGFKGTYAYDKLIDCLCRMVADDGSYDSFIFGGDWRIPVIEGLQPANFIQQQEAGNSMDESGFEREYKQLLLYSINITKCWEICLRRRQSAVKKRFNDYAKAVSHKFTGGGNVILLSSLG